MEIWTLLNDKINLIQFLSFLSMSIIFPSVPPTILKSGGTLMNLGCFMSMAAASRMISKIVYDELSKITKKENLLQYSLIGSAALNVLLLTASSPCSIMANRLLFVLVHQAPMFCMQLSKTDPKDQNSALKSPETQRLVASLMGCAVVGSLIDSKGGFYLLVAIGTLVSAVSVAIAYQVEPQKGKEKQLTLTEAAAVIPKSASHIFSALRDIDIHFTNWQALLIKSVLISNALVVFILYVIMIIFVFKGNGATVNATAAYQTVIICVCGILFNKYRSRLNTLAVPREILEKSALICAVCALILGFSPSYTFYLFMFIPFIISRTIVESFYVDVFEVKQNQKLGEDIKTISAITEIVSPLFIGFLFNMLYQNAYRILAVAPFVVIYYIVKYQGPKTSTSKKSSEETIKKKSAESTKDK